MIPRLALTRARSSGASGGSCASASALIVTASHPRHAQPRLIPTAALHRASRRCAGGPALRRVVVRSSTLLALRHRDDGQTLYEFVSRHIPVSLPQSIRKPGRYLFLTVRRIAGTASCHQRKRQVMAKRPCRTGGQHNLLYAVRCKFQVVCVICHGSPVTTAPACAEAEREKGQRLITCARLECYTIDRMERASLAVPLPALMAQRWVWRRVDDDQPHSQQKPGARANPKGEPASRGRLEATQAHRR